MANVSAALAELEHIERFLRTRYHYPHPIFERLAAVQQHLEREDAPSEPEATAEEPAADISDIPAIAKPSPKAKTPAKPAPKAQKRAKKEN